MSIEIFSWAGGMNGVVFTFYIAVNAGLALFFFQSKRKQLHSLELLFYWCVSSLIVQNYSAIQSMNFKSSIIPDVLGLELAQLLNRTVLYPVLTLMFLNRYAAVKSNGKKLLVIVVYAALFTGMEWLSSRLGVFMHISWTAGWSAVFWLLYMLVFMGIMNVFRNKLAVKGVNVDEF